MTTRVAFRQFSAGDAIAIFVDAIEGFNLRQSYQFMGEHSPCDYRLIDSLPSASEHDKNLLKIRLTQLGYDGIKEV